MTTENINNRLNKELFWSAKPFPCIVLDNFLNPELAEAVEQHFPSKKDFAWTPYLHFNELKYGLTNQKHFPDSIKQVIAQLHSDEFCMYLSEMLGAKKLFPDPDLVGGGLHQTFRNGFLNIHTDFSHHPHNTNWKRKINLLLYFNKNWADDYEGDLELWNIHTNKCEKKIKPIFNRAVIFLTDAASLHGSPKRLKCDRTESRKSIALYYYEEDLEPNKYISATRYYSAVAQPWEKGLIETENVLLKLFTKIRYYFKLKH